MADAITTLHMISRGRTAASAAERHLEGGAREIAARLVEDITGIASGAIPGKFAVRVDGSAAAAAVGTVVVDQSNCTAGDLLLVSIPGIPPVKLTAVADDDDATSGSGNWSIETASDDTTGEQLEACINTHPVLSRYLTAVNTTGSVALTANYAGTGGNAIGLAKDVTTAAALTITAMAGGADAGQRPTGVASFGSADVANDDTVSIGSVTFTWKAAPSGENQIETSTTPATAATRFAAAVNAHSKLEGLVSASVDDDVVTITWLDDPRTGQLVTTSATVANSGSLAWTDTFLTPLTTESYGGTAPREFPLGAP